jgi:hypothetical protein
MEDILLNKVFFRCTAYQVSRMSQTSKQFNKICRDDNLWRHFVIRDLSLGKNEQNVTWNDLYIFVDKLFTDPIFAIPYLEEAFINASSTRGITRLESRFMSYYSRRNVVLTTSNRIVHALSLYNKIGFRPITSLNQIRIL